MNWIRQGQILNEQAQLPVVDDTYPNKYRIYYSKRIEGKSVPMWIDVDKVNPKKILGRSKEPILQLGKPGMFDWAGVMPTKIIERHGKKYLFYIGWSLRQDVPYHNSLGLAISENDGETWTKYSEGPIFNSCVDEPGFIGTVEIIQYRDYMLMYYLSCREWIKDKDKMEPIYDIKIARATYVFKWMPLNETVLELETNEGGIVSPQYQNINGELTLFFAVRGKTDYRTNKFNSYNIQKAVLDVPKGRFIRDPKPELTPEGNELMCAYPCVVRRGDELLMFYNIDFGNNGIHYAITKI